MSYKPYRILNTFVAIVNDGDDVLACYPHGKRGSRMKGTGTVGIVFSTGVINAPTEEEVALFSLPAMSKSAKPIPQDPRGFDTRLSGVARSIEGSQRGREAGIIEKHERDSAKVKHDLDKKIEPKSEIKAEPTPKPEIKPEPEPNVDTKTKSSTKSFPRHGSGTKHTAKTKPATDETKEGDNE